MNGTLSQKTARLWISVIESKNLLTEPDCRPYCVVECEKNEFVTKEAILTDNVYLWKHETML
jgi:hypothetical protein